MGKSRGGLSTKIHAAVDALGNPVRLILTPGQASEYGAAPALLAGFSPAAVLGDKGYDSTALRDIIRAVGAEPVTTPLIEQWALHPTTPHPDHLPRKEHTDGD